MHRKSNSCILYGYMMTRKNIITLPETTLRERSVRIGYIDESVRQLSEDMVAATLDWEANRDSEVGVALAAVQVADLRRMTVVRNNIEDKNDTTFSTFINPEIVKREGTTVYEPEGCLSVPDIYGVVARHDRIKVKALDLEGKPVRLTLEGFLARVFQHEIDHMHGTLFIDHIEHDEYYRLSDDGRLLTLKPADLESYSFLKR